jgi:nitrate reductase NapD
MSEYNICGVLVMTSPSMGEIVEEALNNIDGVEVHARENGGKLIVTVEGPQGRACANTIADFSNIRGVVATSLVYHEIDSDETSSETTELSVQEKIQ